MSKPLIRPAGPDDLPALVAVQLESWRRTYGDVLPKDYLGAAMEHDLSRLWSEDRLARDLVLVAEREGEVVGLSGTILETPETAYLDNLHVALRVEGQGVGRALMAGTAGAVLERGRRALHLTVVTTNARALRFYEALGGARRDAIEDEMFGNPVAAYPIWWEGTAFRALAKTG